MSIAESIGDGGLIFGYGTSHDSGLCVVDAATGHPLFAANRERLSRIKNDEFTPMPLLQWVERTLGPGITTWQIPLIQDDNWFREDHGFYPAERSEMPSYRWTAPEAWIEVDPREEYFQVHIQLMPHFWNHRRQQVRVWINGHACGTLDNGKPPRILETPDGKPLREVRLQCTREIRVPPDPRALGVPIRAIGFRSRRPEAARNAHHATSESPSLTCFSRLARKEFLSLPARRLRGLPPRTLPLHLAQVLRTRLAGYSSNSEIFLGGEFYPIASRNDHHTCHCASAYYASGFQKALIVSFDCMGDEYSCRVFRGEEGFLSPVASYYYEEMPLGANYEIITSMLGFNALRHAGKITGLAAYGKDNPECTAALDEFYDDMWRRGLNHHTRNYHHYMRAGAKGLAKLRELRTTRFGKFSREDIARYIQDRTEREGCALIKRHWKDHPDLEAIALAGGVCANVKLNQRVKEMGFRSIFIQPAMSDAGLCFGAALLEAARQNGGRLEPFRLRDVFLGPAFNRNEIDAAMRQSGLTGEWVDDEQELVARIARLIADKKVVAHFNGRMEYGPRALGNRSILYSAHDPSVNQWLNNQLKRTEFMPFAPAVLAEYAGEYFDNIEGAEYTAEFMTITFDCKERAKKEIPAAIHVPRFYGILKAYHEITGVPAMINTSFNMHEEPIVATPDDAIRSFLQGHLDVLVLGNCIIVP